MGLESLADALVEPPPQLEFGQDRADPAARRAKLTCAGALLPKTPTPLTAQPRQKSVE